jgi:hypothetical protein
MNHYLINLTVLALVVGANSTYVNAEGDALVDNSWKSPIAREFSQLDASGNGLLKPHEASKGNAFNKNSFAKADVNQDGEIDVDEYIYFKTGAWPTMEDKVKVEPEQVSQFIKGNMRTEKKLYI